MLCCRRAFNPSIKALTLVTWSTWRGIPFDPLNVKSCTDGTGLGVAATSLFPAGVAGVAGCATGGSGAGGGRMNQRVTVDCDGVRHVGRVLDVSPLDGLILSCDDGRRVHIPAQRASIVG